VIVVPAEGKTWVSWGTPKVEDALEASEWPRVYRARHEMQEHRFTSMIDHGGLDINDGRKTILGPDRPPQRQAEQLAPSLETAHKRGDTKAEAVQTPQDKVAESTSPGHGKRLEQRQRHWMTLEQALKDAQAQHTTFSEHVAALGPAGQRADRDLRKQTHRTMRTL
jgi:hypothetical protein